MFVTAAYAMLSLETGQLTYASAGHNPPLLMRSRGWESEWLRVRGTVLGVLEQIALEERTVTLEPSDYLVFYTDGVTEAFSPAGDMYGDERLQAVVRTAAGGSAQAMLQAILKSVREFVGDNLPSDDLTLMVLRRAET